MLKQQSTKHISINIKSCWMQVLVDSCDKRKHLA